MFSRQTALTEHYTRKHQIDLNDSGKHLSEKRVNFNIKRGAKLENSSEAVIVKKKKLVIITADDTACSQQMLDNRVKQKKSKESVKLCVQTETQESAEALFIATKVKDNETDDASNLEVDTCNLKQEQNTGFNSNHDFDGRKDDGLYENFNGLDHLEEEKKTQIDISSKENKANFTHIDNLVSGGSYSVKRSSQSNIMHVLIKGNNMQNVSLMGPESADKVGQFFVTKVEKEKGTSSDRQVREVNSEDFVNSVASKTNVKEIGKTDRDSSGLKELENEPVNEIQCEQNVGIPSISNDRVTRFSLKASSFAKGGKTLPLELNMPDFYFIHRIEQLGQVSDSQTAGGRDQFVCILCGEKVNWRRTICRHMRDKHLVALNTGEAASVPEVHDNSANGKLMKMSDYIDMETNRKFGKKLRGVEKQDVTGIFPCEKCGKMFNRLRNYRKHMTTHKDEKDYLCSICVKNFKTADYLRQHMKGHEKKREPYKCSECDFTSSVNIAIHQHRQIHNKNTFLCEICGSAYNDKSTLAKHMRVHDPSRPFSCPFEGCSWRFHNRSMCDAHIQSHTTVAKFPCNLCGYAFRKKHHLRRHESVVHNLVSEQQSVFPKNKISDRGPDHTEYVSQGNPAVDESNSHPVIAERDQFDFDTSLPNGQLVIATDENNINYEIADMGTSIVYQTLLQDGDGNQLDSQTILLQEGSHVQDVAGNEMDTQTILLPEGIQVLYQQEDIQNTDITEIEINSGQEMET